MVVESIKQYRALFYSPWICLYDLHLLSLIAGLLVLLGAHYIMTPGILSYKYVRTSSVQGTYVYNPLQVLKIGLLVVYYYSSY